MDRQDDDETVYCEVQMPLAQSKELLQLVLRESGAHSNLDMVFEHMQGELEMSIDCVEQFFELGFLGPHTSLKSQLME